jgi:hypothetical protein
MLVIDVMAPFTAVGIVFDSGIRRETEGRFLFHDPRSTAQLVAIDSKINGLHEDALWTRGRSENGVHLDVRVALLISGGVLETVDERSDRRVDQFTRYRDLETEHPALVVFLNELRETLGME